MDEIEIGDAQVDKALEEMRERAATFVPVEGRAAQDGDYVLIKLIGTPAGGGDPVQADNILCHIGAEETLGSFTENLRGAKPGETRQFEAEYPDDYPDPKLAGKTYNYSVEVQGIKEKKLPELNDEFAKDAARTRPEAGGVATLDELRKKIRENLDAAKEQQQTAQAREKILRSAREAARFPRSRSAGRSADGYAARARGAVAGGAGRGPARGERRLGIAAAAPARHAPSTT